MPTAPPLSTSPNGSGTRVRQRAGPPRVTFQRRRQLPWIAAGVVLIVGFALAFATISLRSSATRPVLVLARSLPAGHVLAAADLTTVSLPTAPGLATLPASAEVGILGRPVGVPLLAGALLTSAELGSAAAVAAGQAVVALAVKAGQYPPVLGPGDHVQIIDTAPAAAAGTPAAPPAALVSATVLAIDAAPAGSPAAAVVSVQVAALDAALVAARGAAGQVSLVLLPPGSGSR